VCGWHDRAPAAASGQNRPDTPRPSTYRVAIGVGGTGAPQRSTCGGGGSGGYVGLEATAVAIGATGVGFVSRVGSPAD
jgi:hypothetical protein